MVHRSLVRAAGALGVVALLVSPAAQAFTVDDGTGQYQIPKFDLEEQARNFRTTGPDVSASGQHQVETPLGKLQFDVQSRDSVFGSDAAARDRRHYQRMFAPDFLKDRY